MTPIDLEAEEKKKPQPTALTNWLVKNSSTTIPEADRKAKEEAKNDQRKGGKERDMMASWLAKGKRKSDVIDEETSKRAKNSDSKGLWR